MTDTAGDVDFFLWNGASFGTTETLAATTGGPTAIAVTRDARYFAVIERPGGGLSLYERTGTTWVERSAFTTDTRPGELRLTVVDEDETDRLLVTWTAGGDTTEIKYLYLDLDGAVQKLESFATAASSGLYSNLRLIPRGAGEATVFAMYRGDATSIEERAILFHDTELASPRMIPGTGFQFDFTGSPGRSYQLQYTMDFVNWFNLTNITGSTTPVPITDTDGAQSERIYRATSPQ